MGGRLRPILRLRIWRWERARLRELRRTCDHPIEWRVDITDSPGKSYFGPGSAEPLQFCQRCSSQVAG